MFPVAWVCSDWIDNELILTLFISAGLTFFVHHNGASVTLEINIGEPSYNFDAPAGTTMTPLKLDGREIRSFITEMNGITKLLEADAGQSPFDPV